MAAITVKQLRQVLQQHEAEGRGDMIVILSKDAEGNEFSPIPQDMPDCIGVYKPESTWSGEFLSDNEDVGRKKRNAVCLWPTN